MTDQLEQDLRSMLAERATDAGHPTFGGEQLVARGRVARRRRRGLAAGGAAVAVVAALVVGGSAFRAPEALPPARPSESSTPSPTGSTAPSRAEFFRTLATLREGKPLDRELVIGDEIVAPDGDRTKIGLPKGYSASRVSRVPAGWVVVASHGNQGGGSLWFRPEQGAPRQVQTAPDDLVGAVIAADGRRMVVSSSYEVWVRELPSGKVLARTKANLGGFGVSLIAFVGDRVLLGATQGGDGGTRPLAMWDLSTNAVTAIPDSDQSVAAMTPDGTTVLTRLSGEYPPCVTLGTLTDLAPAGGHRFCGSSGELLHWGVSLSPEGRHLAVESTASPNQPLAFADVAVLREQKKLVLRSAALPDGWGQEAGAWMWEDDESLLVGMPVLGQAADETQSVLLRCAVTGSCERVPTPTPTIEFTVVEQYGS